PVGHDRRDRLIKRVVLLAQARYGTRYAAGYAHDRQVGQERPRQPSHWHSSRVGTGAKDGDREHEATNQRCYEHRARTSTQRKDPEVGEGKVEVAGSSRVSRSGYNKYLEEQTKG